ncbi:hypothetical protein MKW94_001975 [Papaver nudicaule]|uniref:60S ribosomal protein L38 n=1 Tax=Papaver nudicaule TaxID=74823 RepID=A0AA41V4Q2_PAPNU|nr:hypothetical protein [Papaver nudicaule]
MPKQINEIKDFLLTSRRKARSVRIKKSKDEVKFKVRCSKYLLSYLLLFKILNDQIWLTILFLQDVALKVFCKFEYSTNCYTP